MGFFDNIKKLVSVEDDEFEEELDFEEEEAVSKKEAYREPKAARNDPPRIFQSERSVVHMNDFITDGKSDTRTTGFGTSFVKLLFNER